MSLGQGITVVRIGTQVVVRLSGDIDDGRADQLCAALAEVETIVLRRVVIDLTEADTVSGAGIDFVLTASDRWTTRLLDPPTGLSARLADRRRTDGFV